MASRRKVTLNTAMHCPGSARRGGGLLPVVIAIGCVVPLFPPHPLQSLATAGDAWRWHSRHARSCSALSSGVNRRPSSWGVTCVCVRARARVCVLRHSLSVRCRCARGRRRAALPGAGARPRPAFAGVAPSGAPPARAPACGALRPAPPAWGRVCPHGGLLAPRARVRWQRVAAPHACAGSAAQDADNWAPFCANAGTWRGHLVRYNADMGKVAEGATCVRVEVSEDQAVIDLQRDAEIGPSGAAVFTRRQINAPGDRGRGAAEDPPSAAGWERGIAMAVASGDALEGSYCMGAVNVEQELVSCEQSLLLSRHSRRLRVVTSFQLTMSGPCSPDFQLSPLSVAVFQEERGPVLRDSLLREASTNLCCAPSFEAAAAVGTVGGDCTHLEGRWRMRHGEFVTAQGRRFPMLADGRGEADGELDGAPSEVKEHLPWRDGTDRIGAPELREVCYAPRDMASSATASLASFAVRMPVEMRIGRRLFIEVTWVLRGEHGAEGGRQGVPMARHSVRRIYSTRGDYLGSAFATFDKFE